MAKTLWFVTLKSANDILWQHKLLEEVRNETALRFYIRKNLAPFDPNLTDIDRTCHVGIQICKELPRAVFRYQRRGVWPILAASGWLRPPVRCTVVTSTGNGDDDDEGEDDDEGDDGTNDDEMDQARASQGASSSMTTVMMMMSSSSTPSSSLSPTEGSGRPNSASKENETRESNKERPLSFTEKVNREALKQKNTEAALNYIKSQSVTMYLQACCSSVKGFNKHFSQAATARREEADCAAGIVSKRTKRNFPLTSFDTPRGQQLKLEWKEACDKDVPLWVSEPLQSVSQSSSLLIPFLTSSVE